MDLKKEKQGEMNQRYGCICEGIHVQTGCIYRYSKRWEKNQSMLSDDTTQNTKPILQADTNFCGEGCSLSLYIDLWWEA